MGNNVVVFRLYSPSGLMQQLLSCVLRFIFLPSTMAQQQQRKSSSDASFIAKYIGDQNESSDEETEIEVFESPDYEPFMAIFRKYKPGLTQVEKEDVLTRGLINLRTNPHM